jgi:hypothetical protein
MEEWFMEMTYAFLHIGDEGTKIMVRKKKRAERESRQKNGR